MVWADCQGRLLVGQLEPEAALGERSCYLEDTPVAAAYHKVGGRVAPGYNQHLKNSGVDRPFDRPSLGGLLAAARCRVSRFAPTAHGMTCGRSLSRCRRVATAAW